MNKLRQLLDEKFPAGWGQIYELLGYRTTYKVTSHTNNNLEKATYGKMEAWEVKAWAKVLNVEHSTLMFKYGCGMDVLTGTEMNRLIEHEGMEIMGGTRAA